jgi:hypothetical protein
MSRKVRAGGGVTIGNGALSKIAFACSAEIPRRDLRLLPRAVNLPASVGPSFGKLLDSPAAGIEAAR